VESLSMQFNLLIWRRYRKQFWKNWWAFSFSEANSSYHNGD